jgi:hypothetical protein
MKNRKEIVARFKLETLLQVEGMVGKRPFEDLSVVQLCEKIRITKVTFYNVYFPQKTDLLDYYFQVWCLKQTAELLQSPKEGLKAIEFLSDKLCELFALHPGIVRGWIYYWGHIPETKKRVKVSVEEKKLLFPGMQNAVSLPVESVQQMTEKFVSEAIEGRQISKKVPASQTASLLLTALFGFFISVQPKDVAQMKSMCRSILLRMLD